MKLLLLFVQKTGERWLQSGIDEYFTRLKHYIGVEITIVPGLRKAASVSHAAQNSAEAVILLKHIEKSDFVVLLDERGKSFSSEVLAQFLQDQMNNGIKRLVFVVGGPFGFDESLYRRADLQLSFSTLTFSHQMIRLLLTEQLYRAMTILRNESYHHS